MPNLYPHSRVIIVPLVVKFRSSPVPSLVKLPGIKNVSDVLSGHLRKGGFYKYIIKSAEISPYYNSVVVCSGDRGAT